MMMKETRRRSDELHNFKKLPTPWPSWGSQKLLRSAKLAAAVGHHRPRSNSTDIDFKRTSRPPILKLIIKKKNGRLVGAGGVKDDEGFILGIDAVRTKLTAELKTAADTMKLALLNHRNFNSKRVEEDEEGVEVEDLLPAALTAAVAEEAAVVRPWNLRKRRQADPCKAPNQITNEKTSVRPSPNATRASRLRSNGCIGGREKTAEARVKFSMNLSKKEIEEDYLMMFGSKPPRRPKKYSKTLQRQFDALTPGLWLSEVK